MGEQSQDTAKTGPRKKHMELPLGPFTHLEKNASKRVRVGHLQKFNFFLLCLFEDRASLWPCWPEFPSKGWNYSQDPLYLARTASSSISTSGVCVSRMGKVKS